MGLTPSGENACRHQHDEAIKWRNSKSFYKDEVKIVKYKNPKKVKIDYSPIYAALKNKESEQEIMRKHNVSKGTISSCKAWITMGK